MLLVDLWEEDPLPTPPTGDQQSMWFWRWWSAEVMRKRGNTLDAPQFNGAPGECRGDDQHTENTVRFDLACHGCGVDCAGRFLFEGGKHQRYCTKCYKARTKKATAA